ncbi:MAG: hypothetical protein ABEL76_00005 [Bradymonadaceae bacterium]
MAETDDSRPAIARWKKGVAAVVAALPCAAMAVMVWQYRWISDDGFINLRIVENLADGWGPVYNIVERVEAYTSTLWLGLLAVGRLLGLASEYVAVGLGLAATVAGMACAIRAAAELRAGDSPVLDALVERRALPLGAAVYATLPVAWTYGTSGLDVGLSVFWLGFSYWASVHVVLRQGRSARRSTWYAFAALLGLGPLVRPELGLFTVAMTPPVLRSFLTHRSGDDRWFGAVLEFGAAMGALPVGYEIFRAGYFAALVPNTAIAKAAFKSRWQQGAYYAEYFFELYRLYLPLGFALAFWFRDVGERVRRTAWTEAMLSAAPVLAGGAYCLYVVKIGGGFMYGRLFLPGFFSLIMPVAVVSLNPGGTADGVSLERAFGAVVVAVWMVVCAGFLRMPAENQHGIGDERRWYSDQAGVEQPVKAEDYRAMYFHRDGRQLRELAAERCPGGQLPPPSAGSAAECEGFVYIDSLPRAEFGQFYPPRERYPLLDRYQRRGIVMVAVRTGIGLRGYVPGPRVHLVDRVGLADPFAARLALEHRGRPGHEKGLPAPWVVGRFSPMTAGEDPRISAARRALKCSPLRDLRRAVEAPMSPGRFLRNIVGAFRFHDLRIPSSPWKAEQRFCDREPFHEQMAGGDGGMFHRARCPVGWGLARLRVHQTAPGDPFVWYGGRCRRLERVDGRIVARGKAVEAPALGGDAGGTTHQLSCPEGEVVVGLRGGADAFVRRLEPVCATARVDDGEVAIEGRHVASGVGEGGDSFDLSCPAGEIAVGTVARTGGKVDAIGISCADPIEKMRAIEGLPEVGQRQ